MQRDHDKISAGEVIVLLFVFINAIILEQGYISHPGWYKLIWFSLPLLLLSLVLVFRKQW